VAATRRRGASATRLKGVVIDSRNPAGLDPPEPGAGRTPWIKEVPEQKTVKNRVHLDLWLPGNDVAPLVALGARGLRVPDDEIDWWVVAEPEGNEFCAFPADESR
jgi:hypothetical protein